MIKSVPHTPCETETFSHHEARLYSLPLLHKPLYFDEVKTHNAKRPPKESERAELHKTIWRIANDLRGSVDGWNFKSYVLSRQ